MIKRALELFAVLIVFCWVANAGDQYAPLPKRIVSAKSIWIDNRTDSAAVADTAYREVRKWGKYSIAASAQEADLVFVFMEGAPSSVNSRTTGTVIGTTVIASSRASAVGSITLTITSASGETIWVNNASYSRRGATNDLIRDLRKRVQSQE